MKVGLTDLGMMGFFLFIIFVAGFLIYSAVDETMVYAEIRDSIVPRDPYDIMVHLEVYGHSSDGWYVAQVVVVDTETDNSSYNMLRYNRDTKEVVISDESFGIESCIKTFRV